jgi:hypothetical protein
MLWVSLGAVVPAEKRLSWSPYFPAVAWLESSAMHPFFVEQTPPSPPPRG